jgi:primosomal protein N' (replication factor Y)
LRAAAAADRVVCRLFLAPLAAVARMALSSSAALKGGGTVTEYRLTSRRTRADDAAAFAGARSAARGPATMRELAEIAGVSEGVLRGMLGQGLLEPVLVNSDRPYPPPDPRFTQPDLAGEQAEAAAEMVSAVEARRFQPFLLDGVTPARARPRPISKPWRRRWNRGGRCWCCCRKSR